MYTSAQDDVMAEDESEEVENMKKARRCPFPGIDMEYIVGEDGHTDLHFTLKFKKVKGECDAVREISTKAPLPALVEEEEAPQEEAAEQNCDDPGPPIHRVVSNVSEDELEVEVDDQLRYNNELHKIVSVDEEGGTAEIVRVLDNGNPNPPINIPLADACERIRQYAS